MSHFGYGGSSLTINLTNGHIVAEPLSKGFIRDYLGGQGFVSKLLYDNLTPGLEPFSPENLLIFAVGPLTGSLWPQSSRYVIGAKSPLTGVFGEAHSAGHWAPELKFAGYDLLTFTGRAKSPVYLWIDDDRIELKSAKKLWGKSVHQTEDIIREDLGDESIRIASIGPAGENMVRIASVVNDYERVAARSGIGAIMGYKHLKAVAVRGTGDIRVADPDKYLDGMMLLHRKMLDDPFTPGRARYGTTNLIELMQEIGRLPSYNLQQGVFPGYEKISGEVILHNYLLKARACYGCVQRCGRYTQIKRGPYAHIGGGPEFESLAALGSRCGVDDVEAVIYAHYLCNILGMDTIGVGAAISWAMECWEKGLLTEEDTDGIPLDWGNADSLIKLVKMIAHRKGFGDILAEGSYRAAKRIGRGTSKYVMTVKKQEIAGQEPRAQKSMGLAMAVAARGADHLYAFPVLDEVGFDEAIKQRYGAKYLPEIGDRLNPKYKGVMVAENENYCALVESIGVCKYGTLIPPTLWYDDVVLALNLTTGHKYNPNQLRLIGERIVNLNRAFNVREGLTRKDDQLPKRLVKDPAPKGPSKGQVVELDQMLDEYYQIRGWDKKSGKPRYETLIKLGLEDVAKDLSQLGIINNQRSE